MPKFLHETGRAVSRSVAAERLFDTMMKHTGTLERLVHSYEPTSVKLMNRLAQRVDLSGARACDVGCGRGVATRQLRELVGPQGHVTGIDVSGNMVEYCREQAPQGDYRHLDISPDVAMEVGGIPTYEEDGVSSTSENLHIPDDSDLWGSFDVVVSLQSLFLMADYQTAVLRHARLLRPGGRFVFALTYFSENAAARQQLANQIKLAEDAERRYQPDLLISAFNWVRLLRIAGLTTTDPELIVLPDGDTYLYVEGVLLSHAPIPPPSEVLHVKYPQPLPEPTNLFA
eukprot:TRINITY_DN4624_c0_g1_i2.p1 TRINITY_DN4624_c0_g1~~TRINITY_DN4624_c0_g1_i2.p1  ORF type:complete len:286 (+),score=84.89 TRINITY_DN4624_c0_g1_i2:123-980(+)